MGAVRRRVSSVSDLTKHCQIADCIMFSLSLLLSSEEIAADERKEQLRCLAPVLDIHFETPRALFKAYFNLCPLVAVCSAM